MRTNPHKQNTHTARLTVQNLQIQKEEVTDLTDKEQEIQRHLLSYLSPPSPRVERWVDDNDFATNLGRNKTGTRSKGGNAAVMIFEVAAARPASVPAAAREEAVDAAVVVGRLGDAAAFVARRRIKARHSIMARGRVAGTKSTMSFRAHLMPCAVRKAYQVEAAFRLLDRDASAFSKALRMSLTETHLRLASLPPADPGLVPAPPAEPTPPPAPPALPPTFDTPTPVTLPGLEDEADEEDGCGKRRGLLWIREVSASVSKSA